MLIDDIDVIGFNDQELEELFTSLYDDSGDEKQDNIVPDVEDDLVSKVGDVWLLGEHKLLCGDSCKS
jgi:N-dimethylarginine dimethylaminohydrolase